MDRVMFYFSRGLRTSFAFNRQGVLYQPQDNHNIFR